jgi:hypothetical protein
MTRGSLLAIAGLLVVSSAASKPEERGIWITYDRYSLQHSEPNWKNSTIAVNVEGGRAGAKYKLRNAKSQGSYRDGGGGYAVSLDGEYRLDGRHTLLLITEETAGGSSSAQGVVQVIIQDRAQATITQEITYDSQSPHSGAWFDAKNGILKIRGRGTEIAHCCPTSEDEGLLKWNGWRFVLLKWRRIPLPPGSGY